MTPLWLAYEVALQNTGGGLRNASEVFLTYPLAPTEEWLTVLRRGLLLGLFVASLVHCLRRQWELFPLLLSVMAEGVVLALALGPLLVFLVGRLGDALPPLPALGAAPVGDSSYCLFAFGGAAWEEVCFRIGAFAFLYLVARELSQFAGLPKRAAGWAAQVLAAVGSSLLFAAAHLEGAMGWLGVQGGEPFRPALFTYRFLAGMLLVGILRFRGPGVAAWSHGVFNLALCLGAGPAVFQ